MSENPFGVSTSDRVDAGTLPACAKTTWSSGSYEMPGQLVAVPGPTAPSRVLLTLPSTGGLNGDGACLYRFSTSSASCRSAGVKSIRSSGTRKWLRAYGAGLVGCGCVGDVFSPGTSDCGTGRSSIGQIGSPVARSNT